MSRWALIRPLKFVDGTGTKSMVAGIATAVSGVQTSGEIPYAGVTVNDIVTVSAANVSASALTGLRAVCGAGIITLTFDSATLAGTEQFNVIVMSSTAYVVKIADA